MELQCSHYADTPLVRAGQAAVWCHGDLYCFGGVPEEDTIQDPSRERGPVEGEDLPPAEITMDAMRRWDTATDAWTVLSSTEYPRSRHGHLLLPHSERRELFLIGGHNWGFGNALPAADFVFSLERHEWRRTAGFMMPNRFAPATCCVGSDKHLVFAGLDEGKNPCNDLFALDLERGVGNRVETTGVRPPPQFKGAMFFHPPEDAAFVFDGWAPDAPPPKVHLLNLLTKMWRPVCTGSPFVRFQPIPCYRHVVALLGGMDRNGDQRRTDQATFFHCDQMKWGTPAPLAPAAEDGHPFAPRTAHAVALIPPEEAARYHGAEAVVVGGNIEYDDTPNNWGCPVGGVHFVRPRPLTLQYHVARCVHRMGLDHDAKAALHAARPKDDDGILDELF